MCEPLSSFTSARSRDWIVSNLEAIGHFRILGIGLELACNGGSYGGISLKKDKCNLHLKRLPRISLTCKLVPVQYREYENGLFRVNGYTDHNQNHNYNHNTIANTVAPFINHYWMRFL